MAPLHLVDSSGWIEYFTDGPNAAHFAAPLSDPDRLVVPTICLYEVFRVVLRERGEGDAIRAVAPMHGAREVPLSPALALEASRLGSERGLAMADVIILATARRVGAILWTLDADFEGFAEVRYFRKTPI